jgi:hypothetical protein
MPDAGQPGEDRQLACGFMLADSSRHTTRRYLPRSHCGRFSLKQKALIANFLTVFGSLMLEVIGLAFIVLAAGADIEPWWADAVSQAWKQASPHCGSGHVAVKLLSLKTIWTMAGPLGPSTLLKQRTGLAKVYRHLNY